ncbi:hypothetical protein ScPMuIL_017052 [Solemya velum]
MGNKQSCCIYTSPKHSRPKPSKRSKDYQTTQTRPLDEVGEPQSSAETFPSPGVPHISDREDLPEDNEGDPSNNPLAKTLFSSRSQTEIAKNYKNRRKSQYDNHHLLNNGVNGELKKYSSCSTIFIDDSTASQPNLKNTIKAVALAIYFHIRTRQENPGENRTMEIYDEKMHPLSREPVPEDYYRREPEHKVIYRFVRNLFSAAQLTAEYAIVTLVYLERLLTFAEIDICPSNWKRIVLGAILLASKVWDDQAVWNVDYCQILKDIAVEDMNELERQFLELLQFNINVPSSVYAKYYFDLRALADANDLNFPLESLSKERALKLEAMSNNREDTMRGCYRGRQRTNSLDGMTAIPRRSKAILS